MLIFNILSLAFFENISSRMPILTLIQLKDILKLASINIMYTNYSFHKNSFFKASVITKIFPLCLALLYLISWTSLNSSLLTTFL